MSDATSTAVRPVTHTPAELRADLATILSYHREYFPNGDAGWAGLRDWWGAADSSRSVGLGDGLAARLIEAAYFENDFRDALAEQSFRTATFPPIGEPEQDWSQIDGEIHDEFPGPIQDQKLAKLRQLALERQNLRRRVVELETERHAVITDPKDPRMLPLLVAAAEEANMQGYCTVYDQISSAVGFPTREELQSLGYLTRSYDVQVQVFFDSQFVTVQVEAADEEEARSDVLGWDTSTLAEYLDDEPNVNQWNVNSVRVSTED